CASCTCLLDWHHRKRRSKRNLNARCVSPRPKSSGTWSRPRSKPRRSSERELPPSALVFATQLLTHELSDRLADVLALGEHAQIAVAQVGHEARGEGEGSARVHHQVDANLVAARELAVERNLAEHVVRYG